MSSFRKSSMSRASAASSGSNPWSAKSDCKPLSASDSLHEALLVVVPDAAARDDDGSGSASASPAFKHTSIDIGNDVVRIQELSILLNQERLVLQERSQHLASFDLVDREALQNRIKLANLMCLYFERLIDNKSSVRATLAKPVASDAISCDRKYHQDVVNVLLGMSKDLPNVDLYQKSLTKEIDYETVNKSLGSFNSTAASCEAYSESLQRVRQAMQRLMEAEDGIQRSQQ